MAGTRFIRGSTPGDGEAIETRLEIQSDLSPTTAIPAAELQAIERLLGSGLWELLNIAANQPKNGGDCGPKP